MEASNSPQLPGYLKGLSCLLIIYGTVLVVSSIAVVYGAFAFDAAESGTSSINTFAIGVGGLIAGILTLALGISGRMAFCKPQLLRTTRLLVIADVAATAIALLCCNAIGGNLPTNLVLNLLLPLCWLAASRQKQE